MNRQIATWCHNKGLSWSYAFAGCCGSLIVAGLALASGRAEQQPLPIKSSSLKSDLPTLMQQANREFSAKNYAEATRLLRYVSHLAPNDARVHFELGIALMKAGNHLESYKSIKQANKLSPDDLEMLLALSELETVLGTPERARHLLERAVQLKPADVRVALLSVKLNVLRGELVQLRENLRILEKRFPYNRKLHAEIGLWLFGQRREDLDDLALAELLRSQRLGQQDPESRLALARLESRLGAFSDAVRDASAVVQDTGLDPGQRAAAAAVVGRSYASLGQAQNAIQYLRMAMDGSPEVEDYYIEIARLFGVQKNHKAAIDALEQGWSRLPQSANLQLALGLILLSAEEYAGATKTLDSLIKKSPDRIDAYMPLADAYKAIGQGERSTQVLRNLSVRQPQFPMIHVLLARSLIEEGPENRREALSALKRAEGFAPTDPDIYYLRGKILVSMGQYEDAVNELLHAIQLDPNSPRSYYQLALAYHRLGKEDLSHRMFEKKTHLESTASLSSQ